MKNFLISAAATAIVLTGTQTATAGSSYGLSESNVHRAATEHHSYSYHGYGIPNAYPAGYDEQSKYGKVRSMAKSMDANIDSNIVEVAVSTGSFNTLVTAVKAAGLVDTLSGKGPFTVFAPTDEAFAKLPTGALEALLADKTKLAQVLTYHVVPGKLESSAVTGVSKLATVEGSELPVASIKIAKTDVMASNGVIHVIDEVLIPDV